MLRIDLGPKDVTARNLLARHFGNTELAVLLVNTRTFVRRVRPDLQIAVNDLLHGSAGVVHFSGIRTEHDYAGIDFGALTTRGHYEPVVCPAEYEPFDIGENEPINCLKKGLWLLRVENEPYAILMSPSADRGFGPSTIQFYAAARPTPTGEEFLNRFFRRLEESVGRSKAFRGKVLSLEQKEMYSGRSSGIAVHRLPPVSRDDLILPAATVALLERNVIVFCKRRAELAKRGQSVKKGLLFYGPPGTGKTYTIRYLAGALPDHTTLLITAEQVGLLPEYMTLARLLQPSIVVIEDADLIARERTTMDNACSEVMLNKLLNEMDGLKEDAQVTFVLTTNRPQTLEAALAARPGRIDQAIEFPLPDAVNREKLVRLYGRGITVSDEVAKTIVGRTEGVSASFIKELMRRSLQFSLERDGADDHISVDDVNAALEEILFKGGSLNATLLGGAGAERE